jgi:hypothetical protein
MNHTHRTYHPWIYKSGFTRNNGHIFNNNKKKKKITARLWRKTMRLRRLIITNLDRKKTQNMRKRPMDFPVQVVSWFLIFTTGCW